MAGQYRYISIDVECIASGTRHWDRVPAKVSVVDQHERIVFDSCIMPPAAPVSYLTRLTGLTQNDFVNVPPLEQVVGMLRAQQLFAPDVILVGQSIEGDIKWLGLQQGVDYAGAYDLAELFSIPTKPGSKFPFIKFSLRHEVLHLLEIDIQETVHSPAMDALYSMKLFNRYANADENYLRAVKDTLRRAPKKPSFAKENPVVDGVCMSGGPACKCVQ